MFGNRRQLLTLIAFASGAAIMPPQIPQVYAQTSRHPKLSSLRSGDFLWPAKPNDVILYRGTEPSVSVGSDVNPSWEVFRDRLVAELRTHPEPTIRKEAEVLATMSRQQFEVRYFRDSSLGHPVPYAGGSRLSVGHVAIVDIDRSGVAWVIEATPPSGSGLHVAFKRYPKGVMRTSYKMWIKKHFDFSVWHGRLADKDSSAGRAVAVEANKYVGKDYWFWSLDLNDDDSFYCSKLVWLSAFRALGLSIDNNQSSMRSFWFSPKQLMRASTVRMLSEPDASFPDLPNGVP